MGLVHQCSIKRNVTGNTYKLYNIQIIQKFILANSPEYKSLSQFSKLSINLTKATHY